MNYRLRGLHRCVSYLLLYRQDKIDAHEIVGKIGEREGLLPGDDAPTITALQLYEHYISDRLYTRCPFTPQAINKLLAGRPRSLEGLWLCPLSEPTATWDQPLRLKIDQGAGIDVAGVINTECRGD